MAESKVVQRVEKLLRLARPDAGSSEHERASAALEAAKLIAENNLVVREKEAAPARPAAPKRRPSRPTRNQSWVVTTTVRNSDGTQTSYTDYPEPNFHNPFPSSPPPGWVKSIAARDSLCADPSCGERVERGEQVWMRMRGFEAEYLHADGPCGW